MLIERRVFRSIDSRQSEREGVEPVGLMFGVARHVADEFVVPRQRIGDFRGVAREPRGERLDLEVGQPRLGFQIAYPRVPPEPILHDISSEVRARVAEFVKAVHVARRQPAAAARPSCDLRAVDVERLPRFVLVVGDERAVVGVAARFADEDHLDTRHRHLSGVGRRVDRNFVERSHVHVVAEPFGALRRVDAFDHRAVLPCRPVGVVVRLRAGGAAADVDACQLQCGRLGEHRPVVPAAARQARQHRCVEGRRDLGGCRVDDR